MTSTFNWRERERGGGEGKRERGGKRERMGN